TKAADPMFGVRGLWGIWPVWLDRIPRRMRTLGTAIHQDGEAGRVGVVDLAGVLLPGKFCLASRLGAAAEQDGRVGCLRSRNRHVSTWLGSCLSQSCRLLDRADGESD